MGIMDDINKVTHKAQELAEKHPDQVKKALERAEEMLDVKSGGNYTKEIHAAGDKAEQTLIDDTPTEI